MLNRIGMTGRKLKDKLKEQVNDINFSRQTTVLSRFNQKLNLNTCIK